MALEIVILAAGVGKRMHSNLPKVLHGIAGKPMLQHLLETVSDLAAQRIHVIVGYGKEQVRTRIESALQQHAKPCSSIINWVEQSEQKGTAHAVMQAMPDVAPDATVLILSGDVPLIALATLKRVAQAGDNLNLLTATLPDPFGLGRIIRNEQGQIIAIVEQKDASAQQQQISEINTNCISVRADYLCRWLPQINCKNAQKEYYLTDVIACAVADNVDVVGISSDGVAEISGVNSKADLAKLERVVQIKNAERLMENGVTLLDPHRFDARGECQFGSDCVVDVNVILEGDVSIGDGVRLGSNSLIRNSIIGDHCVIEAHSVIDNAVIGNHCHIGPFARIRPETVLGDAVRIGNFVEIKKSHIANTSKVNHLSYVGDSDVGKNVNIGAGVITCNYDGANKHRTIIGNDVFVGSDSQLIAPVEVGDGATVGAGSTITNNIHNNALAVSRVRQTAIDNWKRPTKTTKKTPKTETTKK